MKHRLTFNALLELALFLTLAPIAFASTTWYVNGVKGSDSNRCNSAKTPCKTIGHAISFASSGDSIMVAAATYTENLTISISLKIIGSGAQAPIVDGGSAGTVFTISSPTANVTLTNFTIRNGRYNYGGGIRNSGTLAIHHSTISNNLNEGLFIMGELFGGDGGGISNSGTLTISDSTISGNTALYGGGLSNVGTLVINNSTLSGNLAIELCGYTIPPRRICYGGYGGAVTNGGHLTINNGTLGGNSVQCSSGSTRCGIGGILGTGTAMLQNSILGNQRGNCSGTMISKGYNMSSDSTCGFSKKGDWNSTDPMLGPLQNNRGPTQTMALPSGSPAIDAGNPTGCTDGLGHLLTTDQRGYPRHDPEDTGGCDMGAYERQSD